MNCIVCCIKRLIYCLLFWKIKCPFEQGAQTWVAPDLTTILYTVAPHPTLKCAPKVAWWSGIYALKGECTRFFFNFSNFFFGLSLIVAHSRSSLFCPNWNPTFLTWVIALWKAFSVNVDQKCLKLGVFFQHYSCYNPPTTLSIWAKLAQKWFKAGQCGQNGCMSSLSVVIKV